MARPKMDVAAVRERLFVAADDVLRTEGPERLTVSAVAARVGMGQSNVYRYIRSRHHLLELLAERWFADIETAVAIAVAEAPTPEVQIERWVLETMEQKRARHDCDPVLFAAYLNLARQCAPAVSAHVERLRALVAPAVEALAGHSRLPWALNVLDDATALFRTPQLIALHRARISIERAAAVVEAVLLRITALDPVGGPAAATKAIGGLPK